VLGSWAYLRFVFGLCLFFEGSLLFRVFLCHPDELVFGSVVRAFLVGFCCWTFPCPWWCAVCVHLGVLVRSLLFSFFVPGFGLCLSSCFVCLPLCAFWLCFFFFVVVVCKVFCFWSFSCRAWPIVEFCVFVLFFAVVTVFACRFLRLVRPAAGFLFSFVFVRGSWFV